MSEQTKSKLRSGAWAGYWALQGLVVPVAVAYTTFVVATFA